MEHHYGSPSQDVFLPIHSKQDIRNFCNNYYLSVVIQSIMGTELYNFFPSEIQAPTNIIRALWRCRNILCLGENRRVVNLKDDFMIFLREVMHGNLNDKMQHDTFEFYENLIGNLSTQCMTVDENFKAIFMTFVKCFDCGKITGDPIKREKSIILSIPQLRKPVTLESLIYSTFFCNINNRTKILKCDCDSGSFIHESSIFLQPPKVLVIYTSRNIDGRKYCDTAVEIQASLYFDHLVAGKHSSFTYSLVSVIYRYCNIVEQGHFNCALFSNNSVCKVFDDTIIKQATYEEVLLDVVKQRHSHVCFYILDKVIDIHTFAKKESFEPWGIDSGIMKSLSCYLKVEHLFQDKFSRNDLKLVLDCEKRLNDNIIEIFMCSLKEFIKQDKISIVNPLSAPCLSLTGAHKIDIFIILKFDRCHQGCFFSFKYFVNIIT